MKKFVLPFAFLALIVINSCSKESETKDGPDIASPTINFSIAGFPSNNTSGEPIVVSNQIEIKIDAEDAGGIARTEAFIDDVKVGEDVAAPYSIIVNVSSYTSKIGSAKKYKDYVLKVTATDKVGNTTSKEQKINIDNELPSITDVSLKDNSVISGETNTLTFDVADNEELSAVTVYIGARALAEIQDENYELNIDTSALSDGENMLKIEAIDAADNTATHIVNLNVDNTGPEVTFSALVERQILDEEIVIAPDVTDALSNITSVEILHGDTSLALFNDSATSYQLNFDPEEFPVGDHILTCKAVDGLGNENSVEIPIRIYRRLITINIPEDRLVPWITLPVVFISRMDGSLVTYKEILREDRQITLSVAEEFDLETEFMLSFYLEDNSGSTKISTHQNLTRNRPGTLSLATPNRWVEKGLGPQIPIANFFTNDNLLISSGDTHHSNTWLSASANYSGSLNTSEDHIYIGHGVSETNPKPFDSFYLFESNNSSSYKYLLIENPIEEGYVVDKNNFISAGVETKSVTVEAANLAGDGYSNLSIFGALTTDDEINNRYHLINLANINQNSGQPWEYKLNTIFPYFKHTFQFGKYFTERNGAPEESYTIPDLSVSYTSNENLVSIDIQGSGHILGRIRCTDFDSPNYDWYITFNSETTTNIVIPDLPENISNPIVAIQKNGNIVVQSVELLKYESIVDYDDYIDKITKNQTNILDVCDWYEMVFTSKTGFLNGPNHEFVFF